MIVSIHQPHYFPAYQYFDKIRHSDVFVFLDDVQFEKNGWQNRNRIKTKNGMQWLTVPVKHKFGQLLGNTEIVGTKWIRKHIITIEQNFKCKNKIEWKAIKKILNKEHVLLSDLNCELIEFISKRIFNFDTSFMKSSEMNIKVENPDERIIKIVEYLNGTKYIAGQGGKNYMDLDKYKDHFNVVFQIYKEETPLSILHRIL